MKSLEATHPLSAEIVYKVLVDNRSFRERLCFEMRDSDVNVDGRNINFIPSLKDLSIELRIFQNDKIKFVDEKRIIRSKYIFNFDGNQYFLKTIRTIEQNPDGTSHSKVIFNTCDEKNKQIDSTFSEQLLSYVYHRCQKQNYLLSLFVSSLSPAGQVYDSPFPIPFDQVFSEFRYRVSNINNFVQAEHNIDPLILRASDELNGLQSDLILSQEMIMSALRHRDEVVSRIQNQTHQISSSSQALQEEIDRPNPEIQLTDSKNDVAFVFSLIPVAVAFIGIYLKR